MFKVVIIDDEQMTREGLKSFIDWNTEGYEVVGEASDGVEGIQIVGEQNADLAICDIKMSKMNGIDMAFEIKKEFPHCKILFVSGYSSEDHLKSAIRLNAKDFIDKPINKIDFLAAIRNVREELIKEQIRSENYGEITQNLLNSHQIIINSLVRGLLTSNDVNIGHVNELLTYLKIKIDVEGNFRVLLIEDNEKLVQNKLDSIKIKEQQFLLSSLQGIHEKYGVFIFYGNTKEEDVLDYASHIVKTFKQDVLKLAIGKEITNVNNINESYESAKDALHIISNNVTSKVQLSDDSTIPSIIRSIKNYIRNNYEENLSINTISEEVHLSPQYLCKVFKDETETTVNSYITEIRMERAQELLLNHQYKIYEIADMIGYHDANYFTRLYRKTFGESPSEYRDRHHV